LKDEDSRVQTEATKALERQGEPAVKSLIQALKNKDVNFRYGVVIALRKIADTRAAPYLADIVKSARIMPKGVEAITPDVYWAADTLGVIGDPSHIPLLENLKARIIERGIEEKYVDTEIYVGGTSTEDEICMIDEAIQKLK
jgi:HEAT repeat protein